MEQTGKPESKSGERSRPNNPGKIQRQGKSYP